MLFPKEKFWQLRSAILLAPPGACLKAFSGPINPLPSLHSNLISEMQRLRGRIYLEDGAIRRSDLDRTGRHISDLDGASWHLLTVGRSGSILSCIRFRQYANTISCDDLCISRAPVASSPSWGRALRESVNCQLSSAREAGFSYVEIGGWALTSEIRGTTEALRNVLAIYAIGNILGGAIGISTATERYNSSSILRKLGGRPLEWDGAALPPYYDENYKCEMEILHFDSRYPNPRYAEAIHQLRTHMTQIPLFTPDQAGGWATAARHLVPDFGEFLHSPVMA